MTTESKTNDTKKTKTAAKKSTAAATGKPVSADTKEQPRKRTKKNARPAVVFKKETFHVTFNQLDETLTPSGTAAPAEGPKTPTDEKFRLLQKNAGKIDANNANVAAVTFPVTRCDRTSTMTFTEPVTEARAVELVEEYLGKTHVELEIWRSADSRLLPHFSFVQLEDAWYTLGDLLRTTNTGTDCQVELEGVYFLRTLDNGHKHIKLDFST